jgi:hypothetical protein
MAPNKNKAKKKTTESIDISSNGENSNLKANDHQILAPTPALTVSSPTSTSQPKNSSEQSIDGAQLGKRSELSAPIPTSTPAAMNQASHLLSTSVSSPPASINTFKLSEVAIGQPLNTTEFVVLLRIRAADAFRKAAEQLEQANSMVDDLIKTHGPDAKVDTILGQEALDIFANIPVPGKLKAAATLSSS